MAVLCGQGEHANTPSCGGDTHIQELVSVPALRCNPFASRMVELFSGDGSGTLDFGQLLHMLAVFSTRTTMETKTVWAFAMWDFDGMSPP